MRHHIPGRRNADDKNRYKGKVRQVHRQPDQTSLTGDAPDQAAPPARYPDAPAML